MLELGLGLGLNFGIGNTLRFADCGLLTGLWGTHTRVPLVVVTFGERPWLSTQRPYTSQRTATSSPPAGLLAALCAAPRLGWRFGFATPRLLQTYSIVRWGVCSDFLVFGPFLDKFNLCYLPFFFFPKGFPLEVFSLSGG